MNSQREPVWKSYVSESFRAFDLRLSELYERIRSHEMDAQVADQRVFVSATNRVNPFASGARHEQRALSRAWVEKSEGLMKLADATSEAYVGYWIELLRQNEEYKDYLRGVSATDIGSLHPQDHKLAIELGVIDPPNNGV